MLDKKDREETAALEELRNQARQELQEWYGRHEEQMTQTKGLNRYVLHLVHTRRSSHFSRITDKLRLLLLRSVMRTSQVTSGSVWLGSVISTPRIARTLRMWDA